MNNQQIISELLEIINSVLSKDIEEKVVFPVGFTYYHILERIKNNIYSLGKLEKESAISHYHAIGLICRNLLTDFITTGYFILESENEDEMISKIYSHYKSDLEKTDSYLQTIKEIGIINEECLKKIKQRYIEEDKILFFILKYSSELKGQPQTKQIIEKLAKTEMKNPWKEFIVKSYDLWIYFSKYEHFGWYSYEFTRNITNEIMQKRIVKTLFYTTIMTSSCLELLKQDDSLLKSNNLYKKIYDFDASVIQ